RAAPLDRLDPPRARGPHAHAPGPGAPRPSPLQRRPLRPPRRHERVAAEPRLAQPRRVHRAPPQRGLAPLLPEPAPGPRARPRLRERRPYRGSARARITREPAGIGSPARRRDLGAERAVATKKAPPAVGEACKTCCPGGGSHVLPELVRHVLGECERAPRPGEERIVHDADAGRPVLLEPVLEFLGDALDLAAAAGEVDVLPDEVLEVRVVAREEVHRRLDDARQDALAGLLQLLRDV